MELKILNTKDLRLAKVKYYSEEKKAAALADVDAYVFLMRVGDQFINVFNELDDCLIMDRSKRYANALNYVSGELKSGPCYVVEPFPVEETLGRDTISFEDLKEYVMKSDKFFIDRLSLFKQENGIRRFINQPKIKRDLESKKQLQEYLDSFVKEAHK